LNALLAIIPSLKYFLGLLRSRQLEAAARGNITLRHFQYPSFQHRLFHSENERFYEKQETEIYDLALTQAIDNYMEMEPDEIYRPS